MKGIEILSSKEVIAEEKFNWKWFFIMFSLIIVICFVLIQSFTFIEVDTERSNIISISSLIFGVFWGIISGGCMGSLYAIPVKYAMEHKIAILDESAREEVFEKYEVVEQDDKLWTVREKI